MPSVMMSDGSETSRGPKGAQQEGMSVSRLWTRSLGNENVADALQDDFASLIAHSGLVAQDASIGFRLRLPLLQNNQFEIEFISRAYRVRQSQLIPTHSGEDMAARLELGRKRDEDCKRVGA